MAIISKNTNRNTTGNDNTFWLNIEGVKEGTHVAFNPSRPFRNMTAKSLLEILTTRAEWIDVWISCHKKVAIKLRGTLPKGTHFIFGHLNNYPHGLHVDCDDMKREAVISEITEELRKLTIADISKPMSENEANAILARL